MIQGKPIPTSQETTSVDDLERCVHMCTHEVKYKIPWHGIHCFFPVAWRKHEDALSLCVFLGPLGPFHIPLPLGQQAQFVSRSTRSCFRARANYALHPLNNQYLVTHLQPQTCRRHIFTGKVAGWSFYTVSRGSGGSH